MILNVFKCLNNGAAKNAKWHFYEDFKLFKGPPTAEGP